MIERDTGNDGEIPSPSKRRYPPLEAAGRRSKIDELLSVLSHQRRRDVLYYLFDHELASIDVLATTIAASEAEIPDESVPPARRETVLMDLYHNHLPKLTDQRLIEYDPRSGAIRWASPSDHHRALLECCYTFDSDPAFGPG